MATANVSKANVFARRVSKANSAQNSAAQTWTALTMEFALTGNVSASLITLVSCADNCSRPSRTFVQIMESLIIRPNRARATRATQVLIALETIIVSINYAVFVKIAGMVPIAWRKFRFNVIYAALSTAFAWTAHATVRQATKDAIVI